MFVIRLLLLLYVPAIYCKVDYYELLGVTKTATNQEIRRAFKKLAVTLHPDKNQEDPDAHEKFIKITRAYEVLKDADKRKQYDITGEDDSKAKPEYHSYTYYRDHFGIYDDDPHIVTFSAVEFETEVEDSETQWFVNFYSPMCHTCHKMAPIWRALAEKMNGAIYFGAVNCEETWSICRQQRINSYPTLAFYPSNERLMGVRSQEELEKYILSRLKSDIVYVKSKEKWNTMKETHSNWLLMLTSSYQVPTDYKIIASMLRGLIGIAIIYCQSMPCEDWDKEDGLMYMTKSNQGLWAYSPVTGGSPRETVNEVLGLLPGLQKIDEAKFQSIMIDLVEESAKPWLIYFHMGAETEVDTEVKKLPALLSGFNIGRLNCGRYNNVCQGLSISRYPRFAVFKRGGGWEFHHGSDTAQAVAGFAKEAGAATNFRTFGESEFFSEVQSGGAVFVDFYAPWCPPCLRLLPQLRKASLSFSPDQVAFATVDCTIHRELCLGQGVQSYPTTVLFNSTRKPQTFRGQTVDSIVEFVHDLINPHVIELNEDNFYETVGKKKIGEIWMVGYFMPWCGPCQQLSPHYRKLAKMVSDMPFIKIGEVNCEVEPDLCQERGIRSYPHIHLHPHDSEGVSSVIVFNGFQRDAASLRRWLFNFVPSPVVDLTPHEFSKITSDSSVWLVDFYAPWCGHCVSFEPEFKAVARKLEGKVKCGKLNCQDYTQACQRAGISGYPTLKFYSSYHQRGVEINSQQQSVIIEFVESLMKKKLRFADEL